MLAANLTSIPPNEKDKRYTHTRSGILFQKFQKGGPDRVYLFGYAYACRLTIQNYGIQNSGAGAEGAGPTVVEAAGGRLHNSGW